ncbi:MAG: helix-turn-helix transcriptional regulator [Saprospiraceae bacterium]
MHKHSIKTIVLFTLVLLFNNAKSQNTDSSKHELNFKGTVTVTNNGFSLVLMHFAMKMQPSTNFDQQQINASQRISTLFLELLERQFPIEEGHPQVSLRSPSGFAQQLNVHVNHLNRAVKESTRKTTSTLIAERILQEAKILLKHSQWNISEIAYALGFAEVTHFNNFFKKLVGTSPEKFRNG